METAARRAAAGTTCAYCGLDRLDGKQKPEHPIPAILDSEIVVFTVCDDCNRRAGLEVDQPFLDDTFMRMERSRWPSSHPRARGRLIGHPFLNGGAVDADGTHFTVRNGEARYGASVIRETENRILIKSDSPEQTKKAVARLERQLARDGSAIESIEPREIPHGLIEATISRPFSLAIGIRMGAKMALALASDEFDEQWRHSDEAKQLRTWLWATCQKTQKLVERSATTRFRPSISPTQTPRTISPSSAGSRVSTSSI